MPSGAAPADSGMTGLIIGLTKTFGRTQYFWPEEIQYSENPRFAGPINNSFCRCCGLICMDVLHLFLGTHSSRAF